MDECFYLIKKYIQIVVFLLNLISYIVIAIIYNKNKAYYSEYSNLPKFTTNIFIIISFLILFIHTVYPQIICSFMKENLEFFFSDRGKIVVNISIGIMFWSCNDTPLLVFEIINFVSSFALFLCEFIFECKILHNEVETDGFEKKDLIGMSVENRH